MTQAPRTDASPNFTDPPVVEVALGVQFRPLFSLRPIELAALREEWRDAYPAVQEQPPVPPALEASDVLPSVQLVMGPALQTRLWFLNEDETELVQLQNDRLTVNWRQIRGGDNYPRFTALRSLFEARFADLKAFVVDRDLGDLSMTQVEVNYINAIEFDPQAGPRFEHILRNWQGLSHHHLGEPEQTRLALVFAVPDLGRGPTRMYVGLEPVQRPGGSQVLLLTLTVRGAPADDTMEEARAFMDESHRHLNRSFLELTTEAVQADWGRQ